MRRLHCIIITCLLAGAIVSWSNNVAPGGEGTFFHQAALSNSGRYCSPYAREALFDIRGKYLGHSLMRTTPGIYLIQSADDLHGSIKYFHY